MEIFIRAISLIILVVLITSNPTNPSTFTLLVGMLLAALIVVV